MSFLRHYVETKAKNLVELIGGTGTGAQRAKSYDPKDNMRNMFTFSAGRVVVALVCHRRDTHSQRSPNKLSIQHQIIIQMNTPPTPPELDGEV